MELKLKGYIRAVDILLRAAYSFSLMSLVSKPRGSGQQGTDTSIAPEVDNFEILHPLLCRAQVIFLYVGEMRVHRFFPLR